MWRRRVFSLRVSRRTHKRSFVRYLWPDTLSGIPRVQKSIQNHKYPLLPQRLNLHQTLEEQRRKIIILERHVLETAAFDFRSQHPQPYIIKFTKYMQRSSPHQPNLISSPPRNSPSSMENRPRRLPHLCPIKTSPSRPRTSLHPPFLPPPLTRRPDPLPHVPRALCRRRCRHDRSLRLVHPPFSSNARRSTVCAAEVYESSNWNS